MIGFKPHPMYRDELTLQLKGWERATENDVKEHDFRKRINDCLGVVLSEWFLVENNPWAEHLELLSKEEIDEK